MDELVFLERELRAVAAAAREMTSAVKDGAREAESRAAGSSTGPTTANAKSSAGVTPTGLGRALQSTAGRP